MQESSNTAPALAHDESGQNKLALELHARFHSMKTYGKEPESLTAITAIFLRDLSDFPVEKILKAITLHSRRSEEFPTVSNIYGIIKRNGKPPLSKEIYISISKKAGEYRNKADWDYMQDYEAEQRQEYSGFEGDGEEENKANFLQQENLILRQKTKEQEREITRLGLMLRDARNQPHAPKTEITMQERIKNTMSYMRDVGAPTEEFAEFTATISQPQKEFA